MSRPNFANKSRLPPLDGSMLIAITRGSVAASADSASSPGKKTTAASSGSALVSRSTASRAAAQQSIALQQSSTVVSISVSLTPSLPEGAGWMVIDNSNRVYTTNSHFTTFTPGSTTVSFVSLLACRSTVYESSTNSWWSGSGITPGNLVHRSTDDGLTWSQLSLPATTNRYPAFAFTPSAIFAMDRSRVFRSTNGGTTWTQVINYGPDIGGSQIIAIDSTVIVIGPGGTLRISKDNGTTWPGSFFGSAAAIAAGIGGGGNYQNSILYFNNQFWILGSNNSNKTYILTSSDGLTWTITTLTGEPWWAPVYVVRNPVTGLIVAQAGTPAGQTPVSGIRWSEDNGLTWQWATGSVVGKISRNTVLSNCSQNLHFDGVRYVTRLFDIVTEVVSFHTSVDGKTWTEVTTLTPDGGTMIAFAPKITDPNKNLL
jgi:hypothetical protein